jgi:hypothetical protein
MRWVCSIETKEAAKAASFVSARFVAATTACLTVHFGEKRCPVLNARVISPDHVHFGCCWENPA